MVDDVVSRGRVSCDGGSDMLADARADSPDRHARAVPDLHGPSERRAESAPLSGKMRERASTLTREYKR